MTDTPTIGTQQDHTVSMRRSAWLQQTIRHWHESDTIT